MLPIRSVDPDVTERKNLVVLCYLCDSWARVLRGDNLFWHPLLVVCDICRDICGPIATKEVIGHIFTPEEIEFVTAQALRDIHQKIEYPVSCRLQESHEASQDLLLLHDRGLSFGVLARELGLPLQAEISTNYIDPRLDIQRLAARRANRVRAIALNTFRPPPPFNTLITSPEGHPEWDQRVWAVLVRCRNVVWEESLDSFFKIQTAEIEAGCRPKFGAFRMAVSQALQTGDSSCFQNSMGRAEEKRLSQSIFHQVMSELHGSTMTASNAQVTMELPSVEIQSSEVDSKAIPEPTLLVEDQTVS